MYPGPGQFFTTGENAIWKNFAAWKSDEWVDLPGPAEWWPDNKNDLDATGFCFSDKKTGHKQALDMVLTTGKVDLFAYRQVSQSEDDLFIKDQGY
jgi:hypothetical protein